MGLLNLFRKHENLLAVDVGSTGIKVLELERVADTYRIVNIGYTQFAAEVVSNNIIAKPDLVAEQISALMNANEIEEKRVVTAVPAPSVFTKRIKMQKGDDADISASVQMEAANFIPHNIDAVRLDFQVLGDFGKNQVDVLVVAVKNEIIDSVLEAVSMAGLDTAIVDVDFFALQNMFELSYPELREKNIALINIGARYSSVNICSKGESLFTGDISVGGKVLTDALAEGLGIKPDEAEKLKRAGIENLSKRLEGVSPEQIQEIVQNNVDYMASEFSRQLNFFWNATGADEGIDAIMITGGGSIVPNLTAAITAATGIECHVIDPLRSFERGESVDPDLVQELAPLMAIATGLAIREPGDKTSAEEE